MSSIQDIQKQASKLQAEFEAAATRIKLAELIGEKKALEAQTTAPDFWQDPAAAQAPVQQLSKITRRIEPWQHLQTGISEVVELADLNDTSVLAELETQLSGLTDNFEQLKTELKYNGPYDDHDVFISIYAGAGGTDAQDWARMLLRMYTRYAEQQMITVDMLDESAGEEAGIKSVTMRFQGEFVYAKLKGEHGVHRLVRLSPFNADSLRQTSFAKVDILPVIDRPDDVVLDDKDLRIDVYRSGGHGGQSVNTTDSAVRVTHLPTGISVAIQNERSQLQNKETALTILRSRLVRLRLEQHQEKVSELKGPNQSAEWGNQIRSYVLHPYKQVKDLRTRYETSNVEAVLDGDLQALTEAYLEYTLSA